MLTITSVAYSPVLFNFFLGDDFVHLSWLSKCIKEPSLLLFNFNHSWLDVVTTKFYRPLISVFMFTDYLAWRTNGFGFHLTNLLFHLANCLLVYGITSAIDAVLQKSTASASASFGSNAVESQVQTKWSKLKKANLNLLRWPFLSSMLFGLYPLHPEAVSWITGRVDAVVTTFYLGALYAYIRWTSTRKPVYLIVSLLSNISALLSKEMAVTIPAAICAWELYRPRERPSKTSLVPVSFFWALLVVYFGVRRSALGTFVGGYDDSLFFAGNTKAMLTQWLHAFQMTLIPINKNVISSRNMLTLGWSAGMLNALAGLITVGFRRGALKTILLLMALFMISVVPVYKILAIADNLESSRLIYLPSAFLCMLVTLGLSQLFTTKKPLPDRATIAFATLTTIFLSCAFGLLWRNNQVWREAGLECNAIRNSLEKISRNTPANAHFLIIGLPDQINGAYICRNASPGIVEIPQSTKTLTDCIFLNTYDPVFPFGFLKKSLQECQSSVQIWSWNRELQALCRLTLPTGEKAGEKAIKEELNSPRLRFNGNHLNCWTTDFVFMTRSPESMAEKSPRFTFANDICTSRNLESQLPVYVFKTAKQTGEIIPLRSKALWACGDTGELFYSSPSQSNKIKGNSNQPTFQVVDAKSMMPFVDFKNSGYLGTKGFLHLSNSHSSEKIFCSANEVDGADHFSLEILKPNQFLNPAEQNGINSATQIFKELQGEGRTGSIELKLSDLKGPGLYQARLWSVTRTGNHLGAAGDHFIISVD